MQVYKFGGASVKDAEGVVNLKNILLQNRPSQLLVVVSAMGKTTDLLEKLTHSYFQQDGEAHSWLEKARVQHETIAKGLFPSHQHPVYDELNNLLVEIEWILEEEPQDAFDYLYDQIVSIGELLSTTIVAHYLQSQGLPALWVDARNYIATDNNHRDAQVDWAQTTQKIQQNIPTLLEQHIVITQGFIGSTSENFTTTLGREGSDYTAAIFSASLDAEAVTIWKDVPGVLNADPKWFDDTELIPELSYLDAIELTYYGATVIHPKTIKPLQNKGIPLYVRSFKDQTLPGTKIQNTQQTLPVPSFIFKVQQQLISILPKDFSFIVEDNLRDIFNLFYTHKVKINMMHNSAVSFSVSVDEHSGQISELLDALKKDYLVESKNGLELITIRYYNQATIDRVLVDKSIIMELKDSYTCQLLVEKVTPIA